MSRYLITRANGLLFGVAVAILLAASGLTWEGFHSARLARIWTEHSYAVLNTIQELKIAARDAETGQRGYLLTGNDDYLAPYKSAIDRIGFLQGDLQRLTADSPVEQERLRELSAILQQKLEELAQTIELRRKVGLDAALEVVQTNIGRNLTKRMESILGTITASEQSSLEQRSVARDARSTRVHYLVFGGTAAAVIALLLASRMLNIAWSSTAKLAGDQRLLSEQLQASLDSLSQGVGVFDGSSNLIYWNDCFQILLSLPKAMVRLGMPYAAVVEHVAECGQSQMESEDQIRHGSTARGVATTYAHITASEQELEIRRTSMPAGGFVLTVSDMTKRAQAEAVLREAQKMQAIGQLTGGIAHDFNNLLTIIVGNLEFIRSKLDRDSKHLSRIERATWAAHRGAKLTKQLLAFARKQPLEPAPIDLAAALPDIVPLLRRTLGEHIDVRYVETAGLWPALADSAQLESAVLNLALNARDAMPDGGQLTIELANKVLDENYASAHSEVTAGDYAMIAVSDTGTGMPPDVVRRVFEPFFTTKSDGNGSGLGLPMVFGFVKQSGGHIKIYSEVGEGTTVRIYLPKATEKPTLPSMQARAPIDLPRGTATILIVEDEAAVREIAVAIVADLGYRVLQAADGEEALRVFGANAAAVDLVLTDVVLPGKIRGRDVAERIIAIRPETAILFMSGYTENSIVHNGRLDQGVQLISKPFSREQLARKVAECLRRLSALRSDDGGQTENVIRLPPRTEI